MNILFDDIRTLLKGYVKYFDWDFDQLEMDQPAVDYPCALFSAEQMDVENDSEKTNIINLNFRIRFAFKVLSRAGSNTGDYYKNIALEHLSILKAARNAVCGLDSNHYCKPDWISQHQITKASPRIYDVTFATTIWDFMEYEYLKKSDAEMIIKKIEIKTEL